MQVISVVRDFTLYNKLVYNNPHYGKFANFIFFDNTKENKGISTRYNEFLKNYDFTKEDWFIFCHEDWELKENLDVKLKNLDKNFLYGPIGVSFGKLYKLPSYRGFINQSDKNGFNVINIGRLENSNNVEVSTFDCQCLIVHSSLIQKYNLSFDENLFFDLYVEDFCINAKEKFNISLHILF